MAVSLQLVRHFTLTSWTPYTFFAVNLNATKGPIGSILWSQTYNPPAGNVTVLYGGVDPISRVFYETYKEDMQYVAFSLDTGQKLWGPTQSQMALDYYGNDFGGNLDGQCAYGSLYSVGFAGILYCWNATTGALEWTYGNGGTGNSTFSGFNSPYGDYPTFIAAIGNGVIYTETTEHTVLDSNLQRRSYRGQSMQLMVLKYGHYPGFHGWWRLNYKLRNC